MSSLTETQLQAVEQYAIKLTQINDLQTLRRYAVKNYRQNLAMHNTYRSIINHHISIESEYVKSLLGD